MNLKNFPKRLDSKTSCLRITVPENLDLALEGLIRKVLKEQPKTDDIYSFAADYFETLLKIRDKAGAKFTAAQLCPFHNDEDAHEMIKLAGTFSKPASEKLGTSFSSKGKNSVRKKETVDGDQAKKNVRKTKSTERLKDEKDVPNKQMRPVSIKKKRMTAKSGPERGKSEQNIILDEKIPEKEIKKEESDDEEFLGSDPIKELVEKELMEAKSNSKKDEFMEKNPADAGVSESFEIVLTNKENKEDRKLIDDNKKKPEINNTNEALEKESKASEKTLRKSKESNNNQTEVSNSVKEIKSESDKVDDIASEKAAADVEVEKENIKSDEEVKNKKLQDVEAVNNKSAEDLENSSKEKEEEIMETDRKSTTSVEKTRQKNAENANIITDKTLDPSKPLILNKSKENKNVIEERGIDWQTAVIEKRGKIFEEIPMSEKKEKSSEISQDESEKDKNSFISDEILDKTSTSDFRPISKEEEKSSHIPARAPTEDKLETERITETEENQDQPTQSDNQVDREKETKSFDGTTAKQENYQTGNLDGNEEAEIPVTEGNLSDAKGNAGKTDLVDNQDHVMQEKKMTDKETELIKGIEKDPKLSHTEAEKPNSSENFQAEQKSAVTENTADVQKDKIEAKQNAPENVKKLLNATSSEDKKTENEASEKSEDGIKSDVKLKQEKVRHTKESTADTKTELNDIVSSNKSSIPSEDEVTKLSSSYKNQGEDDNRLENSNPPQPPEPTHQNEDVTSGKAENLVKEDLGSTNEGNPTGEKTSEQGENIENGSLSIENSQMTGTGLQEEVQQKAEISENEQTVEQNSESHLTTEGTAKQGKENLRQEDSYATVYLQNPSKTNNDGAENGNEQPRPNKLNTTDTLRKDKKKEPCTITDNHHVPKKQESEKKNQEAEFETEVEAAKNNKTKIETHEICTVSDTQQNLKENNMADEIPNEDLKPTLEIERGQNKNDPKLEEELCTVVDTQYLPKSEATDSLKSREEFKSEAESIESKEGTEMKEPTPAIESPLIIEIQGTEKPNENKEKIQPSEEIQIKTIQTHYYDTLQVPKAVTKEYRVHSVAPPPMNALLSVLGSLQPNSDPVQESLNQEKQTEGIEDVNSNASPSEELNESFTDCSLPTEPKRTDFPNESSQPDSRPLMRAITQNELESEIQKSDSEDLLDLMTPTSGYSLNLSELSWQTVSGLFLDSEKRYSSLEKEEIRYATPNTSKTLNESDQLKSVESKQEVEEIVHKAIIPSKTEAVPTPPREAEEINEESSTETPENLKEKKKEVKPEDELSDNSIDSNNGKSSESDAPIISVEVKTIIETQVLDDEKEDADKFHKEQNGREDKEELQSDVKIQIETSIEIPDERSMHSKLESPVEEKKKLSDENIQEQNNFKSTQIQDRSQQDKGTHDNLTEQTSGKEGSSGESDSVSSAATEIKRTDSIKRNFSSTRSLLLTQSLDFGKKNPLMKTRSLSTFRHGVTDFEVWNTIEKELEEAATKIQSKFRGYKTRKKLQRENAVQITTEESSISTTPVEQEIKDEYQQNTGEFHDSVVLSEYPR